MHATNEECTEGMVLILRGSPLDRYLNEMMVYSGDIHEIASLVIIFNLNLVLRGGLLQSWDRWREARVSIFISHLRSIMTS